MKPEIAVASSGQMAKLSADLDVKSYVKEPKRRVPVIDTADVVILLEKQYYLGGLWTGCCVLPIIDKYFLSIFHYLFVFLRRQCRETMEIVRRYPVGIQTFSESRKGGYLYMDEHGI